MFNINNLTLILITIYQNEIIVYSGPYLRKDMDISQGLCELGAHFLDLILLILINP